jgi:hypothetical protein
MEGTEIQAIRIPGETSDILRGRAQAETERRSRTAKIVTTRTFYRRGKGSLADKLAGPIGSERWRMRGEFARRRVFREAAN